MKSLNVLELEPVDEGVEKTDFLGPTESEDVVSVPFEEPNDLKVFFDWSSYLPK